MTIPFPFLTFVQPRPYQVKSITTVYFIASTSHSTAARQININTRPSGNQYSIVTIMALRVYIIFTTLEPSTTPSKLLALTTPFCLRASSSSHQPKRKSRAMSLNHGVNELPTNPVISTTVNQSTALHTLIFEHCLQLGLVNIFVVANLIHIRVHRHVRGQEEDVIN